MTMHKSIAWALAWLIACSTFAVSQNDPGFTTYIGSGMSTSDPYYQYPVPSGTPLTDTTGYTEVSCALIAETTAVILYAGQSNFQNVTPGAYSVLQTKNQQLDIYNGLCYRSRSAALGLQGTDSFLGTRVADLLINNGHYTRVINVPMAVGGTNAADWANSANSPYLKNRISTVARRVTAAGLTVTHVVWGLGETDNLQGTSQASFEASMAVVIAAYRSAGITAPFIVNKETWNTSITSATIQAAQAAIVDNVTVFAGPDLDSINDSGRFDTTHFNTTGANTAAGLLEAKIILHKFDLPCADNDNHDFERCKTA